MAVGLCIVATTIIALGGAFSGQLRIDKYCPKQPPRACVLQGYPYTTQLRFECFDSKGNSVYIGIAELVNET